MNGYSRTGDTVTLTMPVEDYELLLMALGIAAGSALLTADAAHASEGPDRVSTRTNEKQFWGFMGLANRVNAGNPKWQPYEIPEVPDGA